jgi:hypothetical protein
MQKEYSYVQYNIEVAASPSNKYLKLQQSEINLNSERELNYQPSTYLINAGSNSLLTPKIYHLKKED